MSGFELELDVYYGWCTLRLEDDGSEIEIKAHWLSDALTALVEAIRLLEDGTPSAGVVWPQEVGGGHFVDFLLDTRGGVSIVVHERVTNGSRVQDVFSAERGVVRFRCHVPMADLVTSFVTALRVVRVRSVDSTGFMRDWGRTFPFAAYGELERIAGRRYGYKPVATADVTVEESPDAPRRGRADRRREP